MHDWRHSDAGTNSAANGVPGDADQETTQSAAATELRPFVRSLQEDSSSAGPHNSSHLSCPLPVREPISPHRHETEMTMRLAIVIGAMATVFLMAGRTELVPASVLAAQTPAPAPAKDTRLRVPVDYYKLPNGLKVVLSRDQTTPTAVVAVYYNIGFRNEPKDRT